MIRSPSKYLGLKRLKSILKDNCQLVDGDEYSESELKDRIIELETKKASELKIEYPNIGECEVMFPPKMPRPKVIEEVRPAVKFKIRY